MAYTDKAYVKDLLSPLKVAPVSIFASEYEQMETRWLRGKEIITSTSLWRDATAHFIQLSRESKWVDERSAKDQISILTTKFQEQSAKVYVLTTQLASSKDAGTKNPSERNNKPYTVKPWRLDYKGEKVKVKGIVWNFCPKDHWSDGKLHNGMYCRHTTEEHDEWRHKFDAEKEGLKDSGPEIEVIEGPKSMAGN